MQKNELKARLSLKKKSKKLHKAKARFEVKTFEEDYAIVKTICLIAQILFPAFSVATAITFLALLIAQVIPNVIAAFIMAGVLLTFWELLKNILIRKGMESSIVNESTPYGLLLFVIILFSGSIFMSVVGVKELHENLDNTVSAYKTTSSAQRDSIDNAYAQQITTTKADLAAFKQSVTWKGNINIYNKTTANTIQHYNNEINNLNTERTNTLAAFDKDNTATLSVLQGDNEFSTIAFMVLSGINEIIIVLVGWFLVFYDYKSVEEIEVIVEEIKKGNGSFEKHTHLAKEYIELDKGEQLQIAAKTPNKIGFHVDDNYKIEGLVNDIKAGIRDYRMLTKRNNVNINMVKKYLSEIGE